MSRSTAFEIDFQEQFERFPHAPIVEAVIHWRARAERSLDPDKFLRELTSRLDDYPNQRPQHEIQWETQLGPQAAASRHQTQWQGFRFESADKLHIAQFTKNGLVFSRLQPYEHWEPFEAEATRLWNMFVELANPTEVTRIGVRFINAISPVQPEKVSDFLALPPKSPAKLKLSASEFMHQTTYDVPGHPYRARVIQTMQPASSPQAEGETLILDLDVFTTRPMPRGDETSSKRLREMRYLTDKLFFSLLKPKALKQFREP